MRRRWRRTRARVRVVRSRVRRTPAGRIAWRAGVGLIGGIVLLVGVIAIPGPGQGWAMVFLGLAILSTEFSWAHRARVALWRRLRQGRELYSAQPPRTRALLMTLLVLVVGGTLLLVTWGSLVLTGIPGWLPEPVADLLSGVPGVDR
jgi:uncharacterized protein (TIGR02611 family)